MMNRWIASGTILLLAASAGAAPKPPATARPRPPASAADALEAKVDAYVREAMEQRHVPGLSLAVVRDGKPVLLRGYGLANVELNAPARPDTVFQLASVTKQFTATAVMLLVEEGKLTLGDPVAKHLPDLPDAWKDVTVRHLLDHTSGIKSYTSLPSFHAAPRRDYTSEELIALVRDLPLEFQPGERWAYNNTGYYLLGMLLERVGGKPYGALLEERIFRPLGMTSTRLNDLRAVIKNRADGYEWQGSGWRVGEYVSPTQPFAAGALVSTVADMARWDAALYGEKLLKRSTLERMWTESKLTGGGGTGYGLGWSVGEYRKHRLISHGGGIPGFSTYIARFPNDRLTVIVLCNLLTGNAEAVAKGVAAIYLPDLAQEETVQDTDPKATAFLRGVVESLAAGTTDPELFTPEMRAVLFPGRVKEAKELFTAFGPLKSFTLLERRSDGDLTHNRHVAVFGVTRVIASFAVNKEGKIAGAGIRPD